MLSRKRSFVLADVHPELGALLGPFGSRAYIRPPLMALSDTAIRAAKPRDREFKLADSGGLYLLITPSGGKLWRLKFRVDGREKKLAIGRYPEIGLSDARKRRDEAREQLAAGKDPAREKRRDKMRSHLQAENTFCRHCQRILHEA